MTYGLMFVQAVYGALLSLCGIAFWFWSRLWPEAMAPEQYGYAAYDTPAEVWSMAYIGAGAFIVVGTSLRTQWRGAHLLCVAAFLQLVVMSYMLAISAWHAVNGAPVVIFSSFFFGPAAALFLAANVAAYTGRLRDGAA